MPNDPRSSPLPRSVAEAVAAEQQTKARLRYLYFWGHRPTPGSAAGPGCLSQWWPVEFTEDGHTYRSAEHYMMSHKGWLFGDDETAAKILQARTPGEAKALGRQVADFDEATWREHRYGIVVRGSIAKFGQHSALLHYLLATRNRVLVEASPLDPVWGIGLAADDVRAASPTTWRGLNLLGFALMDAREVLLAEEAA
ncbi:NADAR family protein [Streptomyces sp. ISL-96]|uniref:NADAR family protein n=1 Tax=Streptomyces sp. ISL-96 TaxID=2819191 RepID=UPI001BE881D7|nr:NADAR family protein [Streptomyces sp. ISL-96]MBT2492560.1 NADAR family protein [Streptomyces sp. ISL-96]